MKQEIHSQQEIIIILNVDRIIPIGRAYLQNYYLSIFQQDHPQQYYDTPIIYGQFSVHTIGYPFYCQFNRQKRQQFNIKSTNTKTDKHSFNFIFHLMSTDEDHKKPILIGFATLSINLNIDNQNTQFDVQMVSIQGLKKNIAVAEIKVKIIKNKEVAQNIFQSDQQSFQPSINNNINDTTKLKQQSKISNQKISNQPLKKSSFSMQQESERKIAYLDNTLNPQINKRSQKQQDNSEQIIRNKIVQLTNSLNDDLRNNQSEHVMHSKMLQESRALVEQYLKQSKISKIQQNQYEQLQNHSFHLNQNYQNEQSHQNENKRNIENNQNQQQSNRNQYNDQNRQNNKKSNQNGYNQQISQNHKINQSNKNRMYSNQQKQYKRDKKSNQNNNSYQQKDIKKNISHYKNMKNQQISEIVMKQDKDNKQQSQLNISQQLGKMIRDETSELFIQRKLNIANNNLVQRLKNKNFKLQKQQFKQQKLNKFNSVKRIKCFDLTEQKDNNLKIQYNENLIVAGKTQQQQYLISNLFIRTQQKPISIRFWLRQKQQPKQLPINKHTMFAQQAFSKLGENYKQYLTLSCSEDRRFRYTWPGLYIIPVIKYQIKIIIQTLSGNLYGNFIQNANQTSQKINIILEKSNLNKGNVQFFWKIETERQVQTVPFLQQINNQSGINLKKQQLIKIQEEQEIENHTNKQEQPISQKQEQKEQFKVQQQAVNNDNINSETIKSNDIDKQNPNKATINSYKSDNCYEKSNRQSIFCKQQNQFQTITVSQNSNILLKKKEDVQSIPITHNEKLSASSEQHQQSRLKEITFGPNEKQEQKILKQTFGLNNSNNQEEKQVGKKSLQDRNNENSKIQEPNQIQNNKIYTTEVQQNPQKKLNLNFISNIMKSQYIPQKYPINKTQRINIQDIPYSNKSTKKDKFQCQSMQKFNDQTSQLMAFNEQKRHKIKKNQLEIDINLYKLAISTVSIGFYNVQNGSFQMDSGFRLWINYIQSLQVQQNYTTEPLRKQSSLMWKTKQCSFLVNRHGTLNIQINQQNVIESQQTIVHGKTKIPIAQLIALSNTQTKNKTHYKDKGNSKYFKNSRVKTPKISIHRGLLFFDHDIVGDIIIGYQIINMNPSKNQFLLQSPINSYNSNFTPLPKIRKQQSRKIQYDYLCVQDDKYSQAYLQKAIDILDIPYTQKANYIPYTSKKNNMRRNDARYTQIKKSRQIYQPINVVVPRKKIQSKPPKFVQKRNSFDQIKLSSTPKHQQQSRISKRIHESCFSRHKVPANLGNNIKFTKAARFTQSNEKMVKFIPGPGSYEQYSQFDRYQQTQ